MKRCLAICYGFLFSICLAAGIVRAQGQDETKEIEQVVQSFQESQINLDDISIDDIELVEVLQPQHLSSAEKLELFNSLSYKDRLMLLWAYIKIKTGECKDDATRHILKNQRAYVFGAVTALIALSAISIYYFGK